MSVASRPALAWFASEPRFDYGDLLDHLTAWAGAHGHTIVVQSPDPAKIAAAEAQILAILEPGHPLRLGLLLNYLISEYEIVKDKKLAWNRAKEAFDKLLSYLDQLDEASYAFGPELKAAWERYLASLQG